MSDSLWAALAGVGSAVSLELLRHLLARSTGNAQHRLDDATSFRQDLLGRIGSLEDDCAAFAKERDEWQARYYAEREARTKAEWQIEARRGDSPVPRGDESPQTNLTSKENP